MKIHRRDRNDHGRTLCGRAISSDSGAPNRHGRIVWTDTIREVSCRVCQWQGPRQPVPDIRRRRFRSSENHVGASFYATRGGEVTAGNAPDVVTILGWEAGQVDLKWRDGSRSTMWRSAVEARIADGRWEAK